MNTVIVVVLAGVTTAEDGNVEDDGGRSAIKSRSKGLINVGRRNNDSVVMKIIRLS
jgi:hypothetical protein